MQFPIDIVPFQGTNSFIFGWVDFSNPTINSKELDSLGLVSGIFQVLPPMVEYHVPSSTRAHLKSRGGNFGCQSFRQLFNFAQTGESVSFEMCWLAPWAFLCKSSAARNFAVSGLLTVCTAAQEWYKWSAALDSTSSSTPSSIAPQLCPDTSLRLGVWKPRD